MKYCEKCKVNLPESKAQCPLCQSELTVKSNDKQSDILCDAFPVIPTIYRQFNIFLRIMMFLSISTVVISTLINLIFPHDLLWCLFVLVGNAYIWACVITTMLKRKNLSKVIIYQALFASGISVIFDVWIGYKAWSVNYVLPAICIVSMLSIFIVATITRVKFESYSVYIIINAIVLITPIVLMLTGVTTILWPSFVAIGTDILILSAVFLFSRKDWIDEFKRRFHI